jgi:uncharacterized protein YraI
MSEILVTFKSENIEKTMGVSSTQTIGEFREAAQMLLDLPENSPCTVILERTDETLRDDLSFKDVNIQHNDKLIIISPTEPSSSPPKEDSEPKINHTNPSQAESIEPPDKNSGSGLKDLSKPIVTASIIIGSCIFGGLALSKYIPTLYSQQTQQTQQQQTPQPTPVSQSSISPVSPPSQPPISPPLQPPPPISPPPIHSSSTNAIIIGQAGKKNIRRGPGLEYGVRHIAYPGDRVQIIDSTRNSDNFPWYRIYFPKSRADGWIAGNLIAVDGQSPSQIPSQPYPNPPSSSSGTNATVGGAQGTKNIRSSAGTIYGIVGKVRTGDRIQILGTSYDRGGYQWYNIYDPQSGARGWIAAQLVSRD